MRTRDILRQAAKLLEKGWCRKSYARDYFNESVCPTSHDAISFCAMGAIQRVLVNNGYEFHSEKFYQAEQKAEDRLSLINSMKYGVPRWNDYECNQEDVVAAFKKAANA